MTPYVHTRFWLCARVYPHGSSMHASVDGERTLSRGANTLRDDAQYGPSAVLRLTDQTVIQVDFPGEKAEREKTSGNTYRIINLPMNRVASQRYTPLLQNTLNTLLVQYNNILAIYIQY